MAIGIYWVLRKLKGHSLRDVLEMSMPQFYFLMDGINYEFDRGK